jgi:hypothetical protein
MVAAQKFHSTLGPRIDAEVDRFKAEQQRREPPDQPTIAEHPIDDTTQTGASRDLGGAISIHAPWRRD